MNTLERIRKGMLSKKNSNEKNELENQNSSIGNGFFFLLYYYYCCCCLLLYNYIYVCFIYY